MPKRCGLRNLKSHNPGCSTDKVLFDADGDSYALNLTFASKEDARRAFLATPRIMNEDLDADHRKHASVSLQVCAASLPENLEPVEPPSLSLLVWTDDSVEKWELWDQMATYGVVVNARKCPNLNSCFVVTFAKITAAKVAISTFNTSFPSASCVVVGYYKIGPLPLLWIGDIPDHLKKSDLEDICRLQSIKYESTLFSEVTRDAIVKLSRLSEATAAKRQLITVLKDYGGKDVFADFVDWAHLDFLQDVIERYPTSGSRMRGFPELRPPTRLAKSVSDHVDK